MPLLFKRLPLSLAIAGCVALGGCSAAAPDPASEAQVELLDGEYAVTVSGQAPGILGTRTKAVDDLPPKLCLASHDDAGKIAKLARTYYGYSESCPHSGKERIGNQVSGEVACATDPERAPGGKIGITYTGSLTADSVRLDGKILQDFPTSTMSQEDQQMIEQGKAELEKVSIVVEAKRIGDCATKSW
jgi:hypothetical protein